VHFNTLLVAGTDTALNSQLMNVEIIFLLDDKCRVPIQKICKRLQNKDFKSVNFTVVTI
jgi:hypothetical protein